MKRRLSLDDLSYYIRIGQQRQATNAKNRVASKQYTTRNPTAIHIQGVLGEFVFQTMCANEFKTSASTDLDNTSSRSAKKDTFDGTVFGKKIDVKTVLSPMVKNIFVHAHKQWNRADLFVMILLTFSDPKTNEPLFVPMRAYDQIFDQLQKDAGSFVVDGSFHGFATAKEMFAKQMPDGSFSTPLQPSWPDFCQQIYFESKQEPNKKEQTTTQ